MLRIILLLALIVGLTRPAVAADIAPVPAPVVAPAWSWTGFYLGAHGGYGTASLRDASGWFAGAQAGFNYQFENRFVFGVEVDSAYADIGDSVSTTFLGAVITVGTNIDFLGSARLRVGYGWDRVLMYVTGGGAWLRNELTGSIAFPLPVLTVADSQFHFGWTAGGGVEVGLWGNLTANIEYRYADYGAKTYFAGTPGLTINGAVETHTVKMGLNYLFH